MLVTLRDYFKNRREFEKNRWKLFGKESCFEHNRLEYGHPGLLSSLNQILINF